MRIHAIAAATLAVLTLAACSHERPGYTVSHRAQQNGSGSADLILEGASTEQARDAIHDYAGRIHGAHLYYLKVMDHQDAPRYVCRARWYQDAQAYATYSGHTEQPDTWPYLAITCP